MRRTNGFVHVLVALLMGVVAALLPLGPAQADGTETVGPPSTPIAQGSGVASGGVGLDAGQPMPITLTVPNGATVKQVLIHWEGLFVAPGGPDDTITVNGTEVTGTLIGGPTLFFYSSSGAPVSSTSYRADITGLNAVQPGPNSVSVGDLNFNFTNDGASIHAIYDDGSGLADIQLRDGNDAAYRDFAPPLDSTTPQTFTVAAAEVARDASLILAVGSVEPDRPTKIRITAGAEVTVLTNPLGNDEGAEWDHLVLPVTIPAGATTVTVQILSEDDGTGRVPASLVWVTATLNVPPTAPPPPPPCEMSSTPAITHGSAYGVDASALNLKLINKLGIVSTVAPGAPASQAKQLLTASVPSLVSAKVMGTTSNSTLDPSQSTASATVADVNLLSGLVKATTVRGVSQSVATPNSSSYNSNGSTIQGLMVNNVAVNAAPNSKVAVKALGTTVAELAIHEGTGSSTFGEGVSKSSHSVNMLRLTLLKPFLGFAAGTQVVVAHAQSDAQSPTTTCPDRKA